MVCIPDWQGVRGKAPHAVQIPEWLKQVLCVMHIPGPACETGPCVSQLRSGASTGGQKMELYGLNFAIDYIFHLCILSISDHPKNGGEL